MSKSILCILKHTIRKDKGKFCAAFAPHLRRKLHGHYQNHLILFDFFGQPIFVSAATAQVNTALQLGQVRHEVESLLL
jgi:hypothetical protein